jgi:hypothetical protein
MIRVNLLPEEYRQSEGASWSTLLAFIIVAAAVALSGVGVGIVQVKAKGLENTRNELKTKKEDRKREAEEHTRLKNEIADARKRETTIKDIAQSKKNWAKQLSELTDLVIDGQMWVHELELQEKRKLTQAQKGQQRTGSLRVVCYFVGKSPSLGNEFYNQVNNKRAFFQIFDPEKTSRPRWEAKNISDVYGVKFHAEDEMNLLFPFEFVLRPEKKPEQPPKPGQPPAGKPQ